MNNLGKNFIGYLILIALLAVLVGGIFATFQNNTVVPAKIVEKTEGYTTEGPVYRVALQIDDGGTKIYTTDKETYAEATLGTWVLVERRILGKVLVDILEQ